MTRKATESIRCSADSRTQATEGWDTVFFGEGDVEAMNRVLASGVGLTLLGIAGYIAGTSVAYPGRSASVTAVMVGLTVAAVGNSTQPGDTL